MASSRRHRADERRDRQPGGDPHDKHDKHRKPKRPKKKKPPTGQGTEKIKASAQSVTTGQQDPTAGGTPQDYPNDQGVFSTGPGQAVEYHYHRTGTYAQDYAAQDNLAQFETQERAPNISGPGEIVTSGAANNPT